MVRGSSLAFICTFAVGLVVAACGRQVTPNPPGLGAGGAPLGYMAIFFDVQAPFNFSQYQYMVVLNTSGSGVTPSTDTLQTNWNGYSFALIALGNNLTSYAEPVQFLRNSNPHISPAWLPLHTTPQLFSYNLDNNGTGTEFSILAKTSIFKASPSPGPSSSPSNLWTFNAFTTQASSQGPWLFVDSMGAGGPIDPQFSCCSPPLCMTEPFDNTYYPQGQYTPPDPTAQITSIEIANNPVKPTACP